MACSACSQSLPPGARFCPFCGHQVAATSDEERRLITVLFADIVGYTGLVEYLDPEQAKRLLDDAFERLIADIVAFGGSIDKVLGDGVLALFGAPIAHEDDPDRAIRAALQMHESLAAFVSEHDELSRPVQLRVGINTGEVLFGRVGGTDDYTVMGDVVNVASRLETLAPPGAIYVGDSTAALVSAAIVLDPVDDLSVRGREQSEMVWRVEGLEQHRVDLRVGRDTPFVGRTEQLGLIRSIVDDVAHGNSAAIALVGEAGSGKTRLLAESLASVDKATAVHVGACAPYGETNVWAPIATALFGRIDAVTTSSADDIRAFSIDKAVALFGFDPDDPMLGWLADAVLHIAGHDSPFDDMPLAQSREALFRLIVEALRRRSSERPVILCIDDLHWADNLLIDLLHRIDRSLSDRPFLLLTAQRDDAVLDWPDTSDESRTVVVALEPLAEAEADELVYAITGAKLDPFYAAELYERSGGNPLFLTELADLAGQDADRSELPSSLRVLIAAQLDRLGHEERAVIDNAAVLGAYDDVDSLATFAREMGQSFSDIHLQSLERDGFLELLPMQQWRFRSDVVREVAYQTLTKVDRAERHAGVAHVMLAGVGVPIARTAHHAASAAELNNEIGPLNSIPADMAERAVALLLRAAQRSLDVGAIRQAQRDADRAFSLEPTDEATVRQLRLVRSTAATELRDFERAVDDAQLALESALEANDRGDEGTARRLIGVQSHGIGDLSTARSELDRSIAIFRELDDDGQLAIALAGRGFVEIFGGAVRDADLLLDESEALAEKLGDRRASAWALEHKAMVAFISGDTELAAERVEIASRQFEELGDRGGRSWAEALRAYLAFAERRLDDAEALADSARAESLKLGERWGPAMMDTLVASIRLWTGNFAEAEVLSRRSLTTFRELGDRFGTVQSLAPYCRSLVALGRYEEAERGIEEALSLSETSGSLAFPAMAAAGTAVHLGLGDRAVTIAELALERVIEMGANGGESRTALALALCQAGRADEALGHLLDVAEDYPYTNAVRALALALISDGEQALAQATLVTEERGATYLDRTIASIAAAAAEARQGSNDLAAARLIEAIETASSAGDAVAISLTEQAYGLLGDRQTASPLLSTGWRTVLEELFTSAVHDT